jgi:hypothetical protein
MSSTKFVPVTVSEGASPKLSQNNVGWENIDEEHNDTKAHSPPSESLDNDDDLMSRILKKAKNLSAEDFQVIKDEIMKTQSR